jgi:type VI secretion system secreted protein Hcp
MTIGRGKQIMTIGRGKQRRDSHVDIYAFLDLEGIEGEAQDAQYKDKIEIQSVSFGAVNNSSFAQGTGAGIGKGRIQNISFSKFCDKASMKLWERTVNGKAINSGKLTLLKMSGETKLPYLELDLTNAVVTSWQSSARGDGQLPMETFQLSFVKVQTEYAPQGNDGDASGKIGFAWDTQANAPA